VLQLDHKYSVQVFISNFFQ